MPLNLYVDPTAPDPAAIQRAAAAVRAGGIIIYPTETYYGLGACYSDHGALERLARIKGRDSAKPFPVLIPDTASLQQLISGMTSLAAHLTERYWPGPLTLLFPAAPGLHRLLTGSGAKVGCRISPHPVARALVEALGLPITTTSANPSGGISADSICSIPPELIAMVDVVLDAGKTAGGAPSTIVDVSSERPKLVRPGQLTLPADLLPM